jgi:hypothetical protein
MTGREAKQIAGLYHQEQGFRSHVIMARHGFGRGEYKYFSYPLPPLIQALRTAAYPHLRRRASQKTTPSSSCVAIRQVKSAPHHCSSNTRRKTITVSTAIYTASMPFRSNSLSCSIGLTKTSEGASLS